MALPLLLNCGDATLHIHGIILCLLYTAYCELGIQPTQTTVHLQRG